MSRLPIFLICVLWLLSLAFLAPLSLVQKPLFIRLLMFWLQRCKPKERFRFNNLSVRLHVSKSFIFEIIPEGWVVVVWWWWWW